MAMAVIGQAPRQVAVEVSPEGGKLIISGARYLRMRKKDLAEVAVAFYLDGGVKRCRPGCVSCSAGLMAAVPRGQRCWPG
jgi:hypothetical protein